MEIAEDEEEDNRKRQSTVLEERPGTAKTTASAVNAHSLSLEPSMIPLPTAESTDTFPPPPRTPSIFDTSPPPPREPLNLETFPPPPRDSHSPNRLDEEPQPRKSSQSTRPELYSTTSYGTGGRPKVKLGPRPSLDVNGGRPHTSGATSHYRPVSTLPQGVKIFSKALRKGSDRPKSTHNSESPSMSISPPALPLTLPQAYHTTQKRPHTSGGRPPPSPSSAMSPPLHSPTTPKTPTITPEKARLMKALELRKRQMNMPPPVAVPSEPSPTSPDDSNPTIEVRTVKDTPKEVQDTLAMLDDMAKGEDSAIAFDANSTLKTDESDATRSDSYPVSPVGPSEQAESTRASSLSESTDETVQEAAISKSASEVAESDVASAAHETASTKEKETEALVSKAENLAENVAEAPAELDSETVTKDEISHHIVRGGEKAVTDAPAISPLPPREGSDNEKPVLTKVKKHVAFGEPLDTEEFDPVEHESSPISRPVSLEILSAVAKPTATEDNFPVAQPTPAAEILTEDKPAIEEEFLVSTPKTEVEVSKVETGAKATDSPVEVDEQKVPESKTGMEDSKVETDTPSIQVQPLPSLEPHDSSQKSAVGDTNAAQSPTNDEPTTLNKKRRTFIEPIRTDIELTDRSNSEANLSSDEEFMDELQSAVVQEAKPISVSKSPISPMFPTPKKADSWRNKFSRAASNPLKKGEPGELLAPPAINEPPVQPPARSVSASAAYLNRINQENAKPIAKKVNLGSGISQRIKALEKFSSLAPGASPPATAGPPPGSTPAFFSVRKASVRGASRSPSIAERANSLNKNTPSPSISRESSPETSRNRSNSIKNRVSTFEPTTLPMGGQMRSRPESISVTARIIRDPSQPFQPQSDIGKDPSEYAPLDLKESPLVIDHQKAVISQARETIQERRLSKERRLSSSSEATNTTAKNRRSSITIVKDLINDRRSSFAERRKSINLEASSSSTNLRSSSRPPSVKSPSRPPSTHTPIGHQRSQSITSRISTSSNRDMPMSPSPTSDNQSINEEKGKKSSRATRMLRRMSSSLSSGRKALAHAVSPTLREDPEPAFGNAPPDPLSEPQTPPTPNVNIGDVNVQFPDSLLWKRRSMLLDSHGFLILSPALAASGSGKNKAVGATRRFHLSEFRPPVIPDIEMQELPNSVLLDFFEGSGLQIACEDRAGQGRVLEGKFFMSSSSCFSRLLTS